MSSNITYLYNFAISYKTYDLINLYQYVINTLLEIFWNGFDYQLFYSVFLDLLNINNLQKSFFLNDWYKLFISNKIFYIYLIYFPEFVFFNSFKESLNLGFYTDSKSYISIYDYMLTESWNSPSIQLLDLIFIFYTILLIFIFYFAYYNSSFKENSFIDSSFLSSWILFESEKEIGSLDDLILAVLIVVYFFGWFFYVYSWGYLGQSPELMLSFYLAPFLFFLIIGMPTLLILDFGSCFLIFIRGVGASQLFLAELMYDYINFGAFYVRLFVQLVRIALMFSTFIAMHDVILFNHNLNNSSIMSFDYISDYFYFIKTNFVTFFYISCDIFPKIFIRIFFEIAHTLAVCSIQFGAFFAIVFWFFLFLYTFFCSSKLEFYFNDKRFQKKIN